MTGKEISDAMTTYAKRTDASFPIILTRLYKKRLWPWVLWKKDRRQVSQVIEFPDGEIEDDFKTEIKLLENSRTARKKVGESYLDTAFTLKLKGQAQWEKFEDKLKATFLESMECLSLM